MQAGCRTWQPRAKPRRVAAKKQPRRPRRVVRVKKSRVMKTPSPARWRQEQCIQNVTTRIHAGAQGGQQEAGADARGADARGGAGAARPRRGHHGAPQNGTAPRERARALEAPRAATDKGVPVETAAREPPGRLHHAHAEGPQTGPERRADRGGAAGPGLCGNQPVASMALNLHAIEQMQLRGRRRVPHRSRSATPTRRGRRARSWASSGA